MLDRLYVDNYRCMVNFECRFAPAQLILGTNGSGKTTLLDVLCLLRDFCIAGMQGENSFVGSTRTLWQDVPEQTFELDASGNGGQYTLRLVVDSWGSPVRPRVLKEEVYFSGKPIFRFSQGEVHLFNDNFDEKNKYPFDWHRSALATITERPENTKLSWFKRWLGGVLYLSPDPHQMSGLADREAPYPTRDLSNFAAWFRHLRLEGDDQELLEDLREVIPGFESMALKDAGMGNRLLLFEFFADSVPGQVRSPFKQFFHQLSDGQRVLTGLYTALRFALKPGTTLLFDEPDNFIALKEIEPWLDAVLEKVEDEASNTQVLIVSHHPELLNRLAFKGGVILDRPGGRHTRAQAFSDPSDTGLSPAELVARGWDHE
jgi:predicted ATPase